ncbi:glycosyltransferase [Hydrogenimonas sp.]
MEKTIKVLHTEWSDGWGGQEIRIVEEMCAVRERGVEVFLACRKEAKIRRKALERGIPVHTLPFRGNTDLKTLLGLVRIIRDHRIDIVNTHSGKDTWVGGIAAKVAGAKFIRTRHLSNRVNPSRFNFINELTDFVITTGESVRLDMIRNNRIAPEKILSIPTGIDEKRFSASCCEREAMRRLYDIAPHRIAIGIVAVLRGFKRHDLFIEAARRIVEVRPETLFLVAGDGPRRESVERLITTYGMEKHIRMLGHVERPERVLRALDIFTLTSDSNEGVPQSVIQALMMGLPVVATDVGSTSDLHTGDNFLLIPPGNVESLVSALLRLVDDPSARRELSHRAPASVSEFTRRKMAERIVDVYTSLL